MNGGHNLGMYRMQRFDAQHSGIHWQIGKGGGFHHHQAELRGEALPVNVFLGGPPALILSAIAPLPENVPELMLASLARRASAFAWRTIPPDLFPSSRMRSSLWWARSLPTSAALKAPLAITTATTRLRHDYPVFDCRAILHRKDAIFPATVVGKPRQEDFFIGDYLQELLSPIFPVVMPAVRDLWSYGETGYHSLAAAVVAERYGREAMASAFRILGEGQLSLTKFLLVLDRAARAEGFPRYLEHTSCDAATSGATSTSSATSRWIPSTTTAPR